MDRSGKDFKLLSTFFLLSLALSNKVSASSGMYWFSLFSFLFSVKRLRMHEWLRVVIYQHSQI